MTIYRSSIKAGCIMNRIQPGQNITDKKRISISTHIKQKKDKYHRPDFFITCIESYDAMETENCMKGIAHILYVIKSTFSCKQKKKNLITQCVPDEIVLNANPSIVKRLQRSSLELKYIHRFFHRKEHLMIFLTRVPTAKSGYRYSVSI